MEKLIDADEMLYALTHWKDKNGWYHDNRTDVYHISEIKEVCDSQPEAVARCEDCKYWDTQDRSAEGVAKCGYWSMERFLIFTDTDDFCSYAERRTDDTD